MNIRIFVSYYKKKKFNLFDNESDSFVKGGTCGGWICYNSQINPHGTDEP